LQAQYRSLREEIQAAISGVLESGQFTLGPEVSAFEEEFSAYCGARYGVAVNSGTSALHLALLAAGVGPGDEVITVPFTFVATVGAIGYTGARPVFVDIDPVSYTMDVTQIERAITARTKVLLPVHLYGQPADLDPILAIARRRGLIVIEDASQAHGAEYCGRRVGSLGDMGCFSFYPSKNLGACGEAGLVVTSNSEYARTLSMLRDWGQEQKYHYLVPGYNYRMAGLQGAILRVKLRHLDAWNEARRGHAAVYDELLSGTVRALPYARHVYHIYVVRSRNRDALRSALLARGIQTGIHYPAPVHLVEAWTDLGYGPGDFPGAECAAREVLSLPMYPELTPENLRYIAAAVAEGA
jgi:dTDP-4-amino-4,6-dideoxygalactose transaminase